MTSLLSPILTGSASSILRMVLYGLGAVLLGFICWSAFIKPQNVQRTNQTAEKIMNNLQGSTINVGFGGCATFQMTKPKDTR